MRGVGGCAGRFPLGGGNDGKGGGGTGFGATLGEIPAAGAGMTDPEGRYDGVGEWSAAKSGGGGCAGRFPLGGGE